MLIGSGTEKSKRFLKFIENEQEEPDRLLLFILESEQMIHHGQPKLSARGSKGEQLLLCTFSAAASSPTLHFTAFKQQRLRGFSVFILSPRPACCSQIV